jgi:voltage-gated potassium channel
MLDNTINLSLSILTLEESIRPVNSQSSDSEEEREEEQNVENRALEWELNTILHHIEDWLELPMIILAAVWLVLFVIEVIWEASPWVGTLNTTIWIIFILEFLLRFTLAPRKIRYLRSSWLTILALALPALRIFRITRTLRLLQLSRTVRSMRLVRVISSINRGMGALRRTMERRGFGYVSLLTLAVLMVGSAGMYVFESNLPGDVGFQNYGDAIWWTAMMLTTVGSEYWPQTVEGRILAFLIALYSLGILGYTAGTLASFFMGQDAADPEAELADTQTLQRLEAEIQSLRAELRQALERE